MTYVSISCANLERYSLIFESRFDEEVVRSLAIDTRRVSPGEVVILKNFCHVSATVAVCARDGDFCIRFCAFQSRLLEKQPVY